jgi:hypothetical protein
MPVIYRVDYDGTESRTSEFFEKKGEAAVFRRANKDKAPDAIEKLTLRGREDIVTLLNSLVAASPAEESDAATELGFL